MKVDSIDPSTGEPIASVFCANHDDYQSVMLQAQAASSQWRMVPAPKRGELIRKIADALREHKGSLGRLVSLETGKIKQEGDGEVQEMIDIADFAVGQSRMLYGKTMHSERVEHRMYEQWHPLGVVGVITAFNFPVAVWAWNALIAAVAGNAVVWRPSPKAFLCAIAVQQICNRVLQQEGYPGIFSLIIEDRAELADRLINDRRVALISFTGSTSVGRRVGEAVARRLGKALLELSGNNAVIVDDSADLDLAVPAIVFGSIGTTGQRCTTTRRLFVHRGIYGDVIERLLSAYRQVNIGDPLDPKVLMGPLIDAGGKQRFLDAVQELRQQGGAVLCGGNGLDRPGFFVEPTIATADHGWHLVQRETFGPLLYVMKFDTLENAIVMQNEVSQGLSSSLFTNNLRHAELFLSHAGSDCGIANVNIGTSGAEIGGAFGGEKDTGGGREAGSDAWQAYMRRQTNTINWSSELPLAQGIQFDVDTNGHSV
jgi:aldehyde dehydrogenase (NAD+)